MTLLRRLVFVSTLVLSLVASQRAKAQFSAYGTIGFSDYGFSTSKNSGLYIYQDTAALTGGVSYLFPSEHRWKTGVDVRGEFSPGSRGGEAGIASLQLAFVPRKHRLSPYFQIGMGTVSDTHVEDTYFVPGTDTVYTVRTTSIAVGYAAGLNLQLSPAFDYRIVELQENIGVGSSAIAGMADFSTGVAYHFGHER